jgi:chromosome segregation ATPase
VQGLIVVPQVDVRTKTGLGRLRAGLALTPSWATFEVTDEQLERLRADAFLDLRPPLAETEQKAARADQATGEADELRAQLAAAHARIVELEAELADARKALDESLRELEALTAPAPAAPAP